MVEKDTKKVGCSFQENIAYLERVLPVKESFDIVRRDMEIGERAATFYFIDGFTKDESMLKIMDSLFSAKAEDMPEDGTTFARRHIPYVEVKLFKVLTKYSGICYPGQPACLSRDMKCVL